MIRYWSNSGTRKYITFWDPQTYS